MEKHLGVPTLGVAPGVRGFLGQHGLGHPPLPCDWWGVVPVRP